MRKSYKVLVACTLIGAAACVAGSLFIFQAGRDVPIATSAPSSARMEELTNAMANARVDAEQNLVEAIKLLSQCEEGVVWNEVVAGNYARLVNTSLNPSLKNLTEVFKDQIDDRVFGGGHGRRQVMTVRTPGGLHGG